MKERPILFSGPMVRAILEGRKTQTRRIVKPKPYACARFGGTVWEPRGSGSDRPHYSDRNANWNPISNAMMDFGCPHGQPGDQLWVRESYRLTDSSDCACYDACACKQGVPMYAADHEAYSSEIGPWKPSIHMPRWASRITLEIESVRVERLNAISAEDAIAEGIRIQKGSGMIDGEDCYMMTTNSGYMRGPLGAIRAYMDLWQSINGKGSWDLNPWVWVIQFKRVEAK